MASDDKSLFALRHHFGEGGAAAIRGAFDSCREEIMTLAAERFERRLALECGALRGEFRDELQRLRGELHAETQQLHGDTQQLAGALRGEIHELGSTIRLELEHLRAEFLERHAELLKWAFLFWIGQAATIGGLLTVLR